MPPTHHPGLLSVIDISQTMDEGTRQSLHVAKPQELILKHETHDKGEFPLSQRLTLRGQNIFLRNDLAREL